VIGNIQYPKAVAESVANKLAAMQVLELTTIEIQTAKARAQIREVDAEGIAKAMETINQKLSPIYVQYEAIPAQEKMVNSPNHTEVYTPTGLSLLLRKFQNRTQGTIRASCRETTTGEL
jgi:hypothetical protein